MKRETAEKIIEDYMIGWVHFYVLFLPLGVVWGFSIGIYVGIATLIAWIAGMIATRFVIREAWEIVGKNHPLVDAHGMVSSFIGTNEI